MPRKTSSEVSLSEHQIQAQFIAWFDLVHREISMLAFAIPNGGNRSRTEGYKFKREGVRAGVPDVFLAIPDPTRGYSGLFLEFKTPRGVVRQAQRDYATSLGRAGYCVAVVRSAKEAEDTVSKYLEGTKYGKKREIDE